MHDLVSLKTSEIDYAARRPFESTLTSKLYGANLN
jgi:hypothetical protein